MKDEVSRVGKPDSLGELRLLAQSIDGRYWERDEETRRERTSQPSERKPEKSAANPSSSHSNNPNRNGKKPNTPRDSASSSNHSDRKQSDLGDKLGKDGKLTPAERTRRFANNLCLFCGGVGHTAKDCPKSSSASAKVKARAAKGKSDSKSDSNSAEDSKK